MGRRGSQAGTLPYRPTPETEYRLEQWRAGCARMRTTAEIAELLRIPVTTLQATVYRARKHGHPYAVMHPMASATGSGVSHVSVPTRRASRTRRRAREGRAADTGHGTLPQDE